MARLTAVTASARAGKTTRIVGDIAAEVAIRPPEEIVATTFTIKAADELVERARARLFLLQARCSTPAAIRNPRSFVAWHMAQSAMELLSCVVQELLEPPPFEKRAEVDGLFFIENRSNLMENQ